MEWQRVYYKMGIAISSVAQFGWSSSAPRSAARLIKSYVRLRICSRSAW